MDTRVVNILNKPRIKSGTKEWELVRHDELLTATEISTVLECNPYKSKKDLFLEKTHPYDTIPPMSIQSQELCRWGNTFEPIAKHLYETEYKINMLDVGLLRHSQYSWLGATPDGVSAIGKLLEIKCPWRRKLVGEIPEHYLIQMQIQMEVCEMESCDYFQCQSNLRH